MGRRFGDGDVRTGALLGAICIGYFVDGAIFLLLLLSSSDQSVSWWVTAVVLANLIPPIVLAPALGWVVDRLSGRRAWALALGISGGCAMGLAYLTSPVALVVLAAVQAISAVVVSASVFRLLPLASGMDDRRASSYAVGVGSLAAIGAPPLAALTATLGGDVAFATCGGLLIFASILVMCCAPSDVRIEVGGQTVWHEIWLGSRILPVMRAVRGFLPAIIGVVVVTSVEGVAGVFYLQEVAGSAVLYALLLSAWAVGSLVGVAVTGRHSFRMGAVQSILVGGILVSVAILVEGLVPSALVIAVAFIGGGIGNAIHNVGVRNLVYEVVPREQQAQVWSVVGALFSAAAAVGNFFGTPGLIGSARSLIVWAGAAGVVLTLVTILITGLTRGNQNFRGPPRRLPPEG